MTRPLATLISLIVFSFTLAANANQEPISSSSCEQGLSTQNQTQDLVLLKDGEAVPAQVLSAVVTLAFSFWNENPNQYQSFLINGDQDGFSLPLKSNSLVQANDGTLTREARAVVRSMKIVDSDGRVAGVQSPLQSASWTQEWGSRQIGEFAAIEDMNAYFAQVRQMAEQIVVISRELGADVVLKEKKFLHPSSHSLEPNGGIALAFAPTSLRGGDTKVAFLLTAWGRYDLYLGEPVIPVEILRLIKARVLENFKGRLIQSESLTFFNQGEIYELARNAAGESLPDVFQRAKDLSAKEMDAALEFSGLKATNSPDLLRQVREKRKTDSLGKQ